MIKYRAPAQAIAIKEETALAESQNQMDFKLWHTLLKETVYWQNIDERMARDILARTSIAWANDQQYYIQGLERVNLTKLYEQFKLIAMLKGTHYEPEQKD